MIITDDIRQQFWKQVDMSRCHGNRGGCWEWQGSTNSGGYGTVNLGTCFIVAHRLAYILVCSDDIDNSVIHHTCKNRLCCNPSHLTKEYKPNIVQDPEYQHRYHRMTTRLDYDKARDIRKLYATGEYTMLAISVMFNVVESAIHNIVSNRQWHDPEYIRPEKHRRQNIDSNTGDI